MKEKYINAADCEKFFYEHLDDNGITGALNAIEEMPAADVEPVKHGRWIFKEMDELVPTGELGVTEGHHIHLSSGETFKPDKMGILVLKKHKKVKKPFCSNCGDYGDDASYATPFCPNCGVKMDGGADNG